MSKDLQSCLACWLAILENLVHEPLPLAYTPRCLVKLFTDARSTTPRVAAVLMGERVTYTAWDPDAATQKAGTPRGDR